MVSASWELVGWVCAAAGSVEKIRASRNASSHREFVRDQHDVGMNAPVRLFGIGVEVIRCLGVWGAAVLRPCNDDAALRAPEGIEGDDRVCEKRNGVG